MFSNIFQLSVAQGNLYSLSTNLSNQIDDVVLAIFNHNQYLGTPIQFTSVVPNNVNVSYYKWEIFDSLTSTLKSISFYKNPVFTDIITGTSLTEKQYDVRLTVVTPIDSITKTWRNAITVYPSKVPTWDECDFKIDWSTLGSLDFQNFAFTDNKGKKIGVKGTMNGRVEWARLVSSDPDQPVQVYFYDAVINHTGGGGAAGHAFYFEADCKNIMLHCYKSDGSRGGLVVNGHPTNSTQALYFEGECSGIRLYGAEVCATTAATGAAISMQPAAPTSGSNATNFISRRNVFIDNYVHDTGEEGFYIFHNNDDISNGYYYIKQIGTIISWNLIVNTGRDGIQPGACIDFEAGNNTIINWGMDATTNHESAFSWNGGTNGWAYQNVCIGGKMFLNIQSGNRPMNIYAGETVPRHNYFFANTFSNLPYPNAGSPEPFVIYCQNKEGTGNPGPWNNYIFNNTFYTDKKLMEHYFAQNSYSSDKFTFINNICDKTGTAGDYEDFNINGNLIICHAATTANITLSGFQIIDGVQTSGAVSWILVKNQTNATQNGVYFAASGSWTRHTNADTSGEVQYLQAKVLSGTTNAKTVWYQTTVSPTLGSSNLVFAKRMTGELINNLVRNRGSNDSDILFTNAPSNLSISNLNSVAFAGSPTDVASRIPELPSWGLNDMNGIPTYSNRYPFGAYSDFNLKTIAYVPVDNNPATFTVTPTITGLTNFTGKIYFNANKIGALLYILTTNSSAPNATQIYNGKNIDNSPALKYGALKDLGAADNTTFTGLTQNTTYYVHYFFRTEDFIDTSVSTVNFTTIADVTSPTLSNFRILNADRGKVYFDSSEYITGTTFGGFTIGSPSKTISAINIVSNQLTGHYFTLSSPYTQANYGDTPTIQYSGSGSNLKDLANNSLSSFGSTSITNNIIAEAAEAVTLGTNRGGTFTTSGSTGNWISTGATGGMLSGKKIPSNSNGYVQFTWNPLANGNFTDCRMGIYIEGSSWTYASSNLLTNVYFLTNSNTDRYRNDVYSGTSGGLQTTDHLFRFERTASTNNITLKHSTDGTNWTSIQNYGNIGAGEIRMGVVTGVSGKRLRKMTMQADRGLI